MASKVQTYGPKEAFIEAEEGILIAAFHYFAEARGSDDQYHSIKVVGHPTPHVEIQEYFREMAGRALENRMKEQGIWDE